jgi:Asp-tRNA(Asn)/Glu-tRNA(Gln) amidotransferase C subunit
MNKEEVKKLFKKIQLEIKEEELSRYQDYLEKIKEMVSDFEKFDLPKDVRPMKRIEIGKITLTDLKKISKNFISEKIEKKDIEKNCSVTEDNFILFRKKSK